MKHNFLTKAAVFHCLVPGLVLNPGKRRSARDSVAVTAFSFSPTATPWTNIFEGDDIRKYSFCLDSRSTSSRRRYATFRYPLAMSSSDRNGDQGEDEEDEEHDEYDYKSYNPIDNETPEERESRMKLVRELQKSFYKDEEGPKILVKGENTGTDAAVATNAAATILNLPLWRVQWTELPGSQNVLNVHVPHYTNMFQKILRGKSRRWGDTGTDGNEDERDGDGDDELVYYFGHIFLPGGSENLDNPSYTLKEGDIGTLMKISDSRQQSDGRLTLVVQALERFEIKRVERSHSPYAIADVTILPDFEQLVEAREIGTALDPSGEARSCDGDGLDNTDDERARGVAVSEAFANHPFEYRRVSIDECEIMSDDGTVVGLGVSPLSNYDSGRSLPSRGAGANPDLGVTISASSHHRDALAVAESDTWIQLDELLKLLRIASNGVNVPIPTQLMGLLPLSRSVMVSEETTAKVETVPWPSKFDLGKIVARLEAQDDDSPNTTLVGTHSKSPFVRVDRNGNKNDSDNGRDSTTNTDGNHYSPLRRAQRFSYVVWTLTQSIALPSDDGEDKYSNENILKIENTQERLELAMEKMNKICLLLKKVLRLEGG